MNRTRQQPGVTTPQHPWHRGIWQGLLLAVPLCAAFLLSACNDGQAKSQPVSVDGEVWPDVLRVAYSPSSEDPESRLTRYHELEQYLAQELGMEVDLVRSSSYGPTIEAMRAAKIDLATGGPFSYLIASQKAGAEVIVSRGKADGSYGAYSTVIVTSPKTGIKTMDDLRQRAAQSTFAFVDPASTSGHLVPRGYLESIGLSPDKSFRRVVFAQNHLNVMMTAVAAKVDAAAMSRSTLDRYVERKRIRREELVVLWESAPIPNSPWYARSDLPTSLKLRLRDAFVNMGERDPALLEMFRTQARDPNMVYLASSDQLFDGLREIARGLESMNLLSDASF